MNALKLPLVGASILVAGFLVLTAGAPPAKKAHKQHHYKAHKVTFEHDAQDDAVLTTLPNGKVRKSEHARVKLDGLGERVMTAVVEDDPIAEGGRQKATISDPQTKKTSEFTYTPATHSITIGDGASSVVVVRNPDHTYTVDGAPAATGKDAVELLKGKPAYQGMSPHSLMLAYSYAHASNAAAKATQNCDLPSCMGCNDAERALGLCGGATPPTVYAIFTDLCECAACDKVSPGQPCESCK